MAETVDLRHWLWVKDTTTIMAFSSGRPHHWLSLGGRASLLELDFVPELAEACGEGASDVSVLATPSF